MHCEESRKSQSRKIRNRKPEIKNPCGCRDCAAVRIFLKVAGFWEAVDCNNDFDWLCGWNWDLYFLRKVGYTEE